MSAAPGRRRVIVSGAASGIGRQLVLTLAAGGDRVVGVDLPGQEMSDLPLEEAYSADVSDGPGASAAVQGALAGLGGLDALVNAAGTTGRGSVEETSLEEWDRIFATNVRGAFVMSRAALPALRQARGTVVNLASQLGIVATPGAAAYCASKAAVLHLTKAMALDVAGAGVTVNAVCPGPTETPMLDRYFASSEDPEGERAAFLSALPTGRFVTPAEVVGAIGYLLSPEARSTTGAALVVDGGFIVR
jgi:2-keto-3-deoxy-L-fuconate dehydrogenase